MVLVVVPLLFVMLSGSFSFCLPCVFLPWLSRTVYYISFVCMLHGWECVAAMCSRSRLVCVLWYSFVSFRCISCLCYMTLDLVPLCCTLWATSIGWLCAGAAVGYFVLYQPAVAMPRISLATSVLFGLALSNVLVFASSNYPVCSVVLLSTTALLLSWPSILW